MGKVPFTPVDQGTETSIDSTCLIADTSVEKYDGGLPLIEGGLMRRKFAWRIATSRESPSRRPAGAGAPSSFDMYSY